MLQKTTNSAMQVRCKIESLIRAVLSLDQTIGQVNRLLGEIDLALARVNEVVSILQPVLEKADVTLDQVDATIADLGMVTPKLDEIVGQAADVVQAFSPAFAVNDVFRRQLGRIRLPGSGSAESA
jgi:ABC-type transporter Mla subunit MlaD